MDTSISLDFLCVIKTRKIAIDKCTYISYSGENTRELLNMLVMKSNWEKNWKQGRKFRVSAICELSELFA